jgi:formylmethanofuran dehydrogenase subunit B
LGCDDLSLIRHSDHLTVDASGCRFAEDRFDAVLNGDTPGPRQQGEPASLETALGAATGYLSQARLPLFAGLRGDLADIRAALRLAEHTGGAIDRHNGDALMCNLSVLEESGWMTTSLGEARNRADLVLLVGDGLFHSFPRLAQRLLRPANRLHADRPPELVLLGTRPSPPPDLDADCIEVPPDRLRDFIGVLRTRLAGRPLPADIFTAAAGLAQRLARASYAVVAFSASALNAAPHADLTVRALGALVRELNADGRAALLPLGGSDGETSALQASAWHTGFGPRCSFHAGVPSYQPRAGSARRLLANGEVDLLVWISTLSDEPPPRTDLPTLVLGHPAMRLDREPEVFIPLAVPGVHRPGAIHRGDGLAVLPLRSLADTGLPTGADALGRLLGLLSEEKRPC